MQHRQEGAINLPAPKTIQNSCIGLWR